MNYKDQFEENKAYLQMYVDNLKEDNVFFLDSNFRGFGKTTFINELALQLMADNRKVLVIGHPTEYYCDRFESVISINDRNLRGISKDWVVLVDEITFKQLSQIRQSLPQHLIYGFGKDY